MPIIEQSIVSIEGHGTRPSHMGIGFSAGGVMYTLNITEIHCVAYCTNDDSTKESDDCV